MWSCSLFFIVFTVAYHSFPSLRFAAKSLDLCIFSAIPKAFMQQVLFVVQFEEQPEKIVSVGCNTISVRIVRSSIYQFLLFRGVLWSPEHQIILGLKSHPQNCSGVGFCSGIESYVRGLSHRMLWGDNFVLTHLAHLLLIIIRPITWAFSSIEPMNIMSNKFCLEF